MKAARSVPVAGYYLLYFATVGVTLPFLPAYLKSLGMDATQVGTLLAISPALALFAPSVWGHLSDRLGRPDRVLTAISLGTCVCFAPLLALKSFGAVAAALALYALFNSGISAIADGIALHSVQVLGGSFARLRLWGSLGFIVASVAFGRFVDAPDRRTIGVSLALMAGFSLWSLLLDARTVPQAVEPPFAGLRLLAQRDLLLFLIASALHWIACAPYHGMFAIHVEALHLPLWIVGLSAGLGVVAEVVVMFLYPRLTAHVSDRHVLALAFISSAARWLGMSVVSGATPIVLLNLLHGFTFGAFYVASIAFVSHRVPEGLRARGQALFASFTFGVGGLIGYLGAGAGYDWLGGHRLFAAAAGVELLAAGCVLLTRRRE